MNSNRLRLNASKTEFIWLGSSRRLPKCSFDPLLIGGSIVHPAASVRDLGVILDPALSFANHVAKAHRHLILPHPTATIDSALPYHGLLSFSRPGTDRLETRLLQRAPRWRSCVSPRSSVRCSSCCSEGRSKTSKNEPDIGRNEGAATLARHSSTSQLQAVRPRVSVHGSAPPYLARCCVRVIPGRLDLRSADSAKGRLVVPKANTKTISRRAFAISCPLAWNSLPDDLHDDSLSLMEFRKKLKTVLF